MIMKKFGVLNVKIWCPGNFWNNQNFFPLRNLMEKVHGPVDRVHTVGTWVHDIVKHSGPLNSR
jgi:hypothetical protein